MSDINLRRLKVLIIDDSAFSRQKIKSILNKAPNIEVVGVAFDGQDGMNKILKLKPDVVTLDLEMPGIDGFTLLRWIMKERPLPVIVVSSFGGNSTVFRALQLGAADFVIKPTKKASKKLDAIEEDLLRKFSAVASLRMDKLRKNISLLDRKDVIKDCSPLKDSKTEIVTIGASTGGPTAIQTILSRLPNDFPGTILISQHMPQGFTRQFAERMNTITFLNVREAEDGEPIKKGQALICPGGHHLLLNKTKRGVSVKIQKASNKDRYVPSIDIMMSNVAEVYGSKTMGVILTGMGKDGSAGMKEIKRKKGVTIAESEESTVVYGMANEAILSGAVDKILPLVEIPKEILRNMRGT